MITGEPIRVLTAWAMGVIVAYLAASTCATLAVVVSLSRLDVPLTPEQVLSMIGHDWLGLAGIFLPVVALGFAIALPVAAAAGRARPAWRGALFAAAGAAALVTVHVALKAVFGITPIAVARSVPGLASQALAGAAGGWIFAAARRGRR